MKKLFISQPMNGKTDEEILAERSTAIEKAREIVGEDVEVIDTFYTDFAPDTKPLEYLARSIKDLANADIAYFAKGWKEKRGCKIEYECAKQYGIKIITDRRVHMKLFKTVDEKFAKIGFIKVEEDKYGAIYKRKNDECNYTQTLALLYKSSGKHLIQSYDENLMDENKIGNTCVGLTMYETKLCIKKMKQMGWKMRYGIEKCKGDIE